MPIAMQVLTPETDIENVLRQCAKPVETFDQSLVSLVADLHLTLKNIREKLGFGRALAAPQAGVSLRIIVINLGAGPITLINPEITWRSDKLQQVWDDCLSTPDTRVKVSRHESISLRYQDQYGEKREWQKLPADLAELVQHEYDHLDGILMIDYAKDKNYASNNPISTKDMVSTKDSHLLPKPPKQHRLSLANIKAALTKIDPQFLNSPLHHAKQLSQRFNAQVYLKDETTNPLRCFKGRGAENCIAEISDSSSKVENKQPIVCASAGNWGMALAWSCQKRSYPLTVFVANNANQVKVDKIKALGAKVIAYGDDFDQAKTKAKEYCQHNGYQFIEDGQVTSVSEGAGSIGIEILEQERYFDAIYIPVGNGALITGVARWIKAASPSTKIVGVVPKEADSMYASWKSASPVIGSSANTIADGLAVRIPVLDAVEDMVGLVDDIILVDEGQIATAVDYAQRYESIVLEPSGAAGIAGVMAAFEQGKLENRVAIILTGANAVLA